MLLKELREKPHLSASSLTTYQDCSLLYKFSRIDKIPPEFKSDSLVFGTCIHSVTAEIYQNRMYGIEFCLKEVHESFKKHWTLLAMDNQEIRFADGKDFQSYLADGLELLSVYYENRPDDKLQIISIEEPFQLFIDGCDIAIIGSTDFVALDEAGNLIIVDTKTSSKSYSKSDVENNFQLTLYQMALKNAGFADRDILLRFDCLVKTKIPKFEQYYTTRSVEDEKRAIRKIKAVHQAIQKEVFIPNDTSWRCKNCAYKSACDEWFLQGAI